MLWLGRVSVIYSSVISSKPNQLLQSEHDPRLSITCNSIVHCNAGGVLSPGDICSLTSYFSHAFFSSYTFLPCGVLCWPLMDYRTLYICKLLTCKKGSSTLLKQTNMLIIIIFYPVVLYSHLISIWFCVGSQAISGSDNLPTLSTKSC